MKTKENAIGGCVRPYESDDTKALLERIDALTQSGNEMGNEILSLKRQNAGYKAANERNRKQARAKIDALANTLREREQVIAGLETQVTELRNNLLQASQNMGEMIKKVDEYKEYKEKYWYFYSLPWYKRIFYKG